MGSVFLLLICPKHCPPRKSRNIGVVDVLAHCFICIGCMFVSSLLLQSHCCPSACPRFYGFYSVFTLSERSTTAHNSKVAKRVYKCQKRLMWNQGDGSAIEKSLDFAREMREHHIIWSQVVCLCSSVQLPALQ